MIITPHPHLIRKLLLSNWPAWILYVAYVTLLAYVDDHDEREILTFSIAVPAILGTAISIFLAFRTNSAYDRWWEARKVWGAIVNDSRSFARQTLTLLRHASESDNDALSRLRRQLIYRQIAWCYCLSRSLRKQDPLRELPPVLEDSELSGLAGEKNVPNALLLMQGQALSEAEDKGWITEFSRLQMEASLVALTDHMGKCERIKNTVFPPQYTRATEFLLFVFGALLPPALVEQMGFWAVPVALTTIFTFYVIEYIGWRLEKPFENEPTDTPMTSLSRTIEINLRQMLGERELPETMQPVKGVLL